jgi:hypothetical protein
MPHGQYIINEILLYGDHLSPTQLKRRAPEHVLMLALFQNTRSHSADGPAMAMRPRQRDPSPETGLERSSGDNEDLKLMDR